MCVADQLAALVRGFILRGAEHAVTERATRLAHAMNELIAVLEPRWQALYEAQGGSRSLHPGGSVMWSPKWEWGIMKNAPAQQYPSDYVNVAQAATSDSAVKIALVKLMDAGRRYVPEAAPPTHAKTAAAFT